MKELTAIVVLFAAVGMAFYAARSDRPFRKQTVPGQWPEPSQTPCARDTWTVEGNRITALATYDIKATVLSTERYYFDHGAKLSPIDFAVGWGALSDLELARQLDIHQGGRFFRYRLPGSTFPVSASEIVRSAANMHLIPQDTTVRDRLFAVRSGDVVHLAGRLVEVEGEDRSRWRSSLSRSDSGGGACELMWVERIDWE